MASSSLAEIISRSVGSTAITEARRRYIARDVLGIVRSSPDQWRALCAVNTHPLICIQANRRAGKTTVIGRLILARLIARNNYCVRVVTHRLAAPTRTWLDSGQNSVISLIAKYGLQDEVSYERVAGAIKAIRFSWGSSLYIHDCGHTSAIDSHRGVTAHLWWIDEAQSLHLLAHTLLALILPTRADTGATVIVSGTPGRDIDSSFFLFSRGEKNWHTDRFFAWQNPLFGATFAERWDWLLSDSIESAKDLYRLSADDIARLRQLSEAELTAVAIDSAADDLREWAQSLDPHFQREILGRWVAGGGDYVLDWLTAENLYIGSSASSLWPARGLPVVADDIASRVAALPKKRTGYDASWTAAVGLDLGWYPSLTAWAVLAWSTDHPGEQFVIWSEAREKMPSDEILDHTMLIVSELREAGVSVLGVRADLNGTLNNLRASWSSSLAARFPSGIWLREVDKTDKEMQYRALNADLCRGVIHVFQGDAIDIEGRHLRFKPFDPERPSDRAVIDKFRKVVLPDGRTVMPGDHCLDALRYARPECPYTVKRAEVKAKSALTHDEYIAYIKQQSDSADGFA